MRASKILLYLSFGLFMISCVTEKENLGLEYKYVITNNSKANIKIFGYSKSGNVKETLINSSQTITKSFFSSGMGKSYFYSDMLGGDSIKIVYGNEKFKIYKCFRFIQDGGCSEERNILSVFGNNSDDQNIILNYYIFTDVDYENAEDCSGNCE